MKRMSAFVFIMLLCTSCRGGNKSSDTEAAPRPKGLKARLCEGNEQVPDLRDGAVHRNVIPGFNEAFYFKFPFKDVIDVGDLNPKNPESWRDQMIKEATKKMRPKLLADIKASPQLWMYKSGLREALEKPDQPEAWPPPDMPVEVIDQRGTVDCQTGNYTFTATIVVPRRPLAEMAEVEQMVQEGMREPLNRSLEPLASKGTVTITLPGVVVDALRRNVDRRKMAELRDKYARRLEYADSESKLLVDWLSGSVVVAPFASAEYRLTGDMGLVLSALTKAFMAAADANSTYEIVAVGRADSRPLASRDYVGGANVLLPPGKREAFTAGQMMTTLNNNQQLSVARGYAAAEALDGELHANGAARVQVLYGGDGEINGTVIDNNRRLEITLRKVMSHGQR